MQPAARPPAGPGAIGGSPLGGEPLAQPTLGPESTLCRAGRLAPPAPAPPGLAVQPGSSPPRGPAGTLAPQASPNRGRKGSAGEHRPGALAACLQRLPGSKYVWGLAAAGCLCLLVVLSASHSSRSQGLQPSNEGATPNRVARRMAGTSTAPDYVPDSQPRRRAFAASGPPVFPRSLWPP